MPYTPKTGTRCVTIIGKKLCRAHRDGCVLSSPKISSASRMVSVSVHASAKIASVVPAALEGNLERTSDVADQNWCVSWTRRANFSISAMLLPCYSLLEETVILGVIHGSLVWGICNHAAPAGPRGIPGLSPDTCNTRVCC